MNEAGARSIHASFLLSTLFYLVPGLFATAQFYHLAPLWSKNLFMVSEPRQM
ncbi:hypothetical protein HNQ59_003976 [Chitinivorax tropicus]|uniref:Uncharacterized protein n=1 Tax=Chitinivorax tropicus TaxID=714531 RepID=A0A840MZU2_9PROT|nr:hypothetical protein [Chitinivorax tropicus]